VRLTLAIALRRRGFDVQTARDGFAAMEMLEREAFQWVIADMRMPGMTGVELAGKVNLFCSDTRTVLISAYRSEKPLRELGVEAFLEKPIDEAQLVKVLRRDAACVTGSFAGVRGNCVGVVE
jgi:YesN/AraC family two-component response regulator